jgi:type II secretion system protein J
MQLLTEKPNRRNAPWSAGRRARGLVTQTFSLPYRRFSIGAASTISNAAAKGETSQTESLRYGRLKVCVTGEAGFTLVEVLLALAICAIVLVAVNAVFATAVRLRDRTSAAIEAGLPIERTLDRLRADLKGVVGPRGFLAGDFKCGAQAMGLSMGLSGEAGGTGLDFFSSTGQIGDNNPWGDVQEVLYELKAPADRNQEGMDLVRCVNRNLLAMMTQTPEYQTMLSHVDTIQFDCFDGSQWRSTWDTSSGDTNLPTAVRVRIQLVANPGEDARQKAPLEMMVPLVTATRTNQVARGAQ